MRTQLRTLPKVGRVVLFSIAISLSGCGGEKIETRKTPGPVVASPAESNLKPAPENSTLGPPTALAPPTPPAAGLEAVKGSLDDREDFKLIGEPNDKEDFKLFGRGDGQDREEVSISTIPAGVDGSMFRLTGSTDPGHFNLSPLSSGSSRTFPKELQVLTEFGYSPDGLPYRIRLATNDPVEMALVPAGEFIRGIEGMEPELGPRQSIYLDAFYMDVLEVTVERYARIKEVMTKAKRTFVPPVNLKNSPVEPALGIAHSDAVYYAKWAGKELPSEAQWEKAARGSDGARFPWGNGRPVWDRIRLPDQIDSVGTFPADVSPYGILDLAGNAREWCQDTYSPKAYAQTGSTPESLRNPLHTLKLSGEAHYVVRGGARDWSVWFRGYAKGAGHDPGIGFRCVYRLQEPKKP